MIIVSVKLDDQQQAKLKMILIDKDAETALLFLKEIICDQVQTALYKGLCSYLDKAVM